jgi:hypothetical protein
MFWHKQGCPCCGFFDKLGFQLSMKKLGLASILLTSAFFVNAQSFYAARKERSLLLIAGTGTSTYLGELADDGDYFDAKPSLNVGLQYYLSNRFSLRSEVTWFTLKGDDAANQDSRTARNLSFTSNNYEINFSGIISLLPQGRRFYQRPGFNLYAFGGVGVMYYNPKTEYQGQKYALRPLRTELVDYSSFGVVFPYGLGLRFKIHPLANISLEGGYRKTFTDYLDDVSTVHVAQSSFTDPIAQALTDRRPEIGLSLAEPGHIRGNPTNNDSYFLFNVKLEYYLPTEFLSGSGSKKLYKSKRKAFYRYNKRGGMRRR